MRYIRHQPHGMSCGPVAVLNALKWLGYSASYRDHIFNFEWDFKNGTRHNSITQSLREYGVKFKIKSNPTAADIERILDNGRSVVLSWAWYEGGRSARHCIFIDGHTLTIFLSKNTWSNKSTKKDLMPKKTLNKYFRIGKRHDVKPKIWEIIK